MEESRGTDVLIRRVVQQALAAARDEREEEQHRACWPDDHEYESDNHDSGVVVATVASNGGLRAKEVIALCGAPLDGIA